MAMHRIAAGDLSSEAFVSNLMTTSLCARVVARAIEKLLLINVDAMEETNRFFLRVICMFCCRTPVRRSR
jgi:hypothetical protein